MLSARCPSSGAYIPSLAGKYDWKSLLQLVNDLQELYLIGFEYGRDVQYVVFRIGRF